MQISFSARAALCTSYKFYPHDCNMINFMIVQFVISFELEFLFHLLFYPKSVLNLQDADGEREKSNIANFSHVWNKFINSLREEDLISNK